jgi:hypothetical protein
MTEHPTYFEQADEQDKILHDALSALRQREDNGEVTVAEAATQRVDILAGHLHACRKLRVQILGNDAVAGPVRPTQLARIRAAHPEWVVTYQAQTTSYRATRPGREAIEVVLLDDLAERLAAVDSA